MSQLELDQLFEALSDGADIRGWGYSMHLHYETLFDVHGRLWQRARGGSWFESVDDSMNTFRCRRSAAMDTIH